MKIQYRYRPAEYGDQLVRMYLLTNDEESKLGTSPLPDGVVRVFRSNGKDGLSYLTQQSIKYIPIGDKIELNLGPDPGASGPFHLQGLGAQAQVGRQAFAHVFIDDGRQRAAGFGLPLREDPGRQGHEQAHRRGGKHRQLSSLWTSV